MEHDPPQADGKASRRGRFTARLFGKDRKISNADSLGKNEGDLNDFLHGSSDKLHVQHPAPPVAPPPASSAPPTLAKLDTSSVSRYPNAHDFGGSSPQLSVRSQQSQQSQQSLTLLQRPQPSNVRRGKGLTVRFADTFPEVIGEGGDETEAPPAEIGRRRRAKSAPAPPPYRLDDMGDQMRASSGRSPDDPAPTSSGLRRTKTGYSIRPHAAGRELPAATPTSSAFLGSPTVSHDEKRRSFIEVHQAEMRKAEGMAFQKAVRSASTEVPPDPGQAELASTGMTLSEAALAQVRQPPEPDSPSSPAKKAQLAQSPASVYSNNTSSPPQKWANARNAVLAMDRGTASPSVSRQKSTSSQQDVVSAANDDAMTAFVARTRHLFELFRLQSETVRPLLSCAPDDTARAGLWWFLQGRMALEITIRERPSSPQAEQRAEMARQQAYADLAKSYWLMQEIYPKLMATPQRAPTLPGSVNEPDEVQKTLSSNLRKLAMSMKRNGFLPPEDAFLPATIDKTIWVEYPPLSQDIVALLRGYWGSALANLQNNGPSLGLMESMPLGDTTEHFSYGRIVASVYLMEQGMESEHYFFPCLLSIVRPQKQTDLAFIITSQHAAIQLKIQNNKSGGPSWDDIQWRPDSCTIKMKLPRGFMLVIKASQADYKLLWTMYEFSYKIHATLYPRKDEQPVFGTTLRSFQYFDSDPQSRTFPQDVVSQCEVALFERLQREGAATGPRTYHRGFRIAVVTGPKTRTLSGINHVYSSRDLLQIGFLRGDQNLPALLLKFDDGRTKGSMVLTLSDEKERISLHGLLTGMYQHHDEISMCEVGVSGFLLTQQLDDREGFRCWKKVQPQRIKVINDENAGEHPPTVLADRLRVVMECKDGSTMTDRINVAPGEFRIRLDVKEPTLLGILRLPQTDMTVSIPDQAPRDLRAEMAEALKAVQTSPTIRSYRFANHADLHAFQAAVTGFTVLFDGMASTFAIARRRMVVPIHKKWEAGATRVQVVQQEGVTQLLAFFDDFHHGHCMGLVLKGTDVFETSGRAGKAGLKIVDAKFPLPRVADEGAAATPPDVAFVCLDYPDLPGEHDDISIIFESEAGKSKSQSPLAA